MLGVIVQWGSDCKFSEVMKGVNSQRLNTLHKPSKTPCGESEEHQRQRLRNQLEKKSLTKYNK